MEKKLPTIESLFSIFMETQYRREVDPMQEESLRMAFFVGFDSCLTMIDVLAEITDADEDAGETSWQILLAEFEKFATENDRGEKSTNH